MDDNPAFSIWATLPLLLSFFTASRAATLLLRGFGTLVVVVELSILVMRSIDLSSCQGNFLKGIVCPPEVKATFAYDLASWSTSVFFFGGLAVLFAALPVLIAAAVLEFQIRFSKGNRRG